MTPPDCRVLCPDDGVCHHDCTVACFRVLTCSPLTGYRFKGRSMDTWPEDMAERHRAADEASRVDPAERGGAVGNRHPETSRRAAAGVRRGSQQSALLAIVVKAGDAGVTCFEATTPLRTMLGRDDLARNQVATRMGELAAKGLVTRKPLGLGHVLTDGRPASGFVERATDGATACVWYATPAGVAERGRLTSAEP